MITRIHSKFLIALVALPVALQLPVHAQSLWRDDAARPMYADNRGVNIGDILTIVVQENTTATKNNETKTEKSSSLTAQITSFFFPGWLSAKGSMPAVQYNADAKHDGSGAINNSEAIVAHVAVKVMDVLANHNLVIEGKRETSFSDEKQTIILRGVVRPEDVNSDNTVLSYNVADATISITGKGSVSDTQRKGWFTQIWDKVTPF